MIVSCIGRLIRSAYHTYLRRAETVSFDPTPYEPTKGSQNQSMLFQLGDSTAMRPSQPSPRLLRKPGIPNIRARSIIPLLAARQALTPVSAAVLHPATEVRPAVRGGSGLGRRRHRCRWLPRLGPSSKEVALLGSLRIHCAPRRRLLGD